MTEDTNGTCEGCIMLKRNVWCYILKKGREKNCPCRSCLVKVMCIASCDKYSTYVEGKDKQIIWEL